MKYDVDEAIQNLVLCLNDIEDISRMPFVLQKISNTVEHYREKINNIPRVKNILSEEELNQMDKTYRKLYKGADNMASVYELADDVYISEHKIKDGIGYLNKFITKSEQVKQQVYSLVLEIRESQKFAKSVLKKLKKYK